jgi:HEAT repeat protein
LDGLYRTRSEGRGRVARNREASGIPSVIELFVKSLVVTAKAVALYPPASSMPLQTAEGAESLLREALRERSEVRLSVTGSALLYRGEPLFPSNAAYAAFASEMRQRRVTEMRFHSGARARDIVAFLSVLECDPEEVRAAGGFERRLWEQGVGTITVSEAGDPGTPDETGPGGETPADTIARLIGSDADDPDRGAAEFDALVREAEEGTSDGDVAVVLVFLAGVESDPSRFETHLAAVEPHFSVLIARDELPVAADVADALRALSQDPDRDPDQRARLEAALQRLSGPDDLRALARALRLHPPDSTEHVAARRLGVVLGEASIEPLLEQLADEADLGTRKSLVDLLSLMAPRHIAEFGARIGDSRWYVVRNIVCVLGSTRSSAVLPYLQRTLRHEEPRVRRETVRALSGIDDRVAYELLVAALSDDDDQNVQLAARYLGAAEVLAAVPALEELAKGEGRGSRETGPRVEAIESLGKIGDPGSLRTLESLAGRRSVFKASRGRELRAAAEAAIEGMKAEAGLS